MTFSFRKYIKNRKKKRLTDTFNEFAAKAVKDFPKLKDKFIVYSCPSKTWHGTAPENDLTQELRDELLNDIEAENEGGTTAFAYHYRQYYIMAYIGKNKYRSMTSANDSRAQEIFAVMHHELAHLTVPGGDTNKHTDNFCESVADAFSFVCQTKEFGSINRTIKAAIWLGTVDFILNSETTHYTVSTLTALAELAERKDLSQLTPTEAANLAYRISLENTYSDRKLRHLANIFKPVTQQSRNDFQSILNTCAEIMLTDHGRDTSIVFQITKTMLEPFLEGQMDILRAHLSPREIKKLKFDTPLWDQVRTEIKKHDSVPQQKKSSAEIQALDLFLLGKFDRSPQKLITPAKYEKKENQFRLRLERRKYLKSAKAAQKVQKA